MNYNTIENTSSIIDLQQGNEEECCVCYEYITDKLICGHYIHSTCVAMTGKLSCPLCRCPVELEGNDMIIYENVIRERLVVINSNHLLVNLQYTQPNEYRMDMDEKIHGVVTGVMMLCLVGYLYFYT